MIRTLQSLRFVFIMLVVLSHYIGKSFDFGGECGVSFFFILSGFVLSVAYSERISKGMFSMKALVKKQYIKIYPLHIIMFVLMFSLDLRLGVHYDIFQIIPNILLLQSWLPADRFYFVANGSSWFLCDILFFYMVFRLLNTYIVRELRKNHLVCIFSLILILYIGIMATIPDYLVNPILYANPLTRLLDFSIGIMLYRIYISYKGRKIKEKVLKASSLKVSVIEFTLIISLITSAIAYIYLPQRVRTVSLFWINIPFLIYFFAMSDNSKGMVSTFLQRKSMIWLGNISFDIYIIHIPVLRIYNSISLNLGMEINTITHFILFVIILVLLSYITNVTINSALAKLKR